jgi:hypothetical protein
MKILLQNNPDKFGITKYQMNWPAPGDKYYTAEGGVRRTYYSVNAVPTVFFNSKAVSVNQNTFNTAYNEPAFIDIAGNFNVSGTNITVNFDISSYLATPDVRVYAIVNEKMTTGNYGTNGETEFYHVMMKMLPDANGTTTSFAKGEIKSFSFTQNMASTNVEEMSDLEVHVFVQNHATKYVFNSNFLVEYTDTKLNPPTNLVLADNENGTVAVTWDAPATGTPTGYNIYLNNVLIQANHPTTSYTATLVNPLGYQAFKVNAIYSVGVSVPVAGYIITSGNDCPQPKSLEAVQEGADVVLTWVAPDEEADYYKVYLDGTLNKDNITETTYTLVEVPAGEHVFGVTAVTDDCESEMLTVTLKVVADDCPQPTDLEAIQEGNNVILTWIAPADVVVDSYIIYLDGEPKDNTNELTYTFIDAPEGTHKYGVSAVIGECESEISEIEFTTTTGILELQNTFTLYPNPVSGTLNINAKGTITDCQIFNIQGQLIYSTKSDVKEIVTDGWTSGVYIIRITTEKRSAEKRFIKN